MKIRVSLGFIVTLYYGNKYFNCHEPSRATSMEELKAEIDRYAVILREEVEEKK